ncbi:hypothetical protein [Castellaniella sp.]|uniref:hypothetical protein n=1 Tax=Castellaniella sp. TaxID=1955812 RepID=UPI002AFE1DA3|nr:hypothetical protein [Castellaniella sp.]
MGTVTIKVISEALGLSKRAAEQKAAKAGWTYTTGKGKGAPRLYDPTQLPSDIREALVSHALISRAEPSATSLIPAETVLPAVLTPDAQPLQVLSDLKGWQREIMNARLVLVREVVRLSRLGGKMRAVGMVVEQGNAGTLAPELQRAVEAASAKRGSRAPLSERTVLRWISDFEAAGEKPEAQRR